MARYSIGDYLVEFRIVTIRGSSKNLPIMTLCRRLQAPDLLVHPEVTPPDEKKAGTRARPAFFYEPRAQALSTFLNAATPSRISSFAASGPNQPSILTHLPVSRSL